MPDNIITDLLLLLLALLLVVLNGFFVAAEFALVKLRRSRIEILVQERRPFSKTAAWLSAHLNRSLSVCQLGITMASLGLGWLGEPAVANLLRPLFTNLGIHSEKVLHLVAFFVAFTFITVLHIVVGEQAPKILAITKPEFTVLTCSLPLKIFYILAFPFMWFLDKASDRLLKLVGIDAAASSHDTPFSEEELRTLVAGAHARGELPPKKHQLLDAVFNMDMRTARQIMLPRPDVVFFRVDQTLEECLEIARRTKHTRFPLCKSSLDDLVGVIHIKDLIVQDTSPPIDLEAMARQPRYVPETLVVSRLLKFFQATRQHLAFVLDEHGAVQGIVTLENVLEELIGSVQDEFDEEPPPIVPDGSGSFLVYGSTSLEGVNEKVGISLADQRVDTISGLLFARIGRVLKAGDRIDLGPAIAEVMEVRSTRAWKVRLTVKPGEKEKKRSPPSS